MEAENFNESSAESLDGSYYQVNPAMTYSPNSEPLQILTTCVTATTTMDETLTQVQNSLDHQPSLQMSTLMSDRQIRRDDSVSSVSSSILFAPEDFVTIQPDKVQELKNTLENLDISMLKSMTTSEMLASTDGSLFSRPNSKPGDQKGNKKLEIQFTKSPQTRDLDPIIVFFENKKASGGGDILSVSELDKRNNIVTIEFKSSQTKKRLLQKGTLAFRKFKFFINEPIDKNAFSLDRTVMILTNVSEDEDPEVVQMFAENLVINEETSDDDSIEMEDDQDTSQKPQQSGDDNEIVELSKSAVFQRMFVAKFRKGFDMTTAQERLARRPILNGKRIELMDAYKTNIVLVRDAKFQPLKSNIEPITEHLTELFKLKYQDSSSLSGNWFSLRLIEPFLLVRLFSQDDLAFLLKEELIVDGQTYFSEHFCNYDLFMSEVERLGNLGEADSTQAAKESMPEITETRISATPVSERPVPNPAEPNAALELISQPAAEQNVGLETEPDLKESETTLDGDEKPSSRLDQQRPWYDLDAHVDARVKAIIFWKELYLGQFISHLTSSNSEVVLTGDSFRIQCTLTFPNDLLDAPTWLAVIKSKTDEILDQFEYFKMPQPADCESLAKKISHEKEKVRVLFTQDGSQRVIEVYGLKQPVQEYVAELMVCLRQQQNLKTNQLGAFLRLDQENESIPPPDQLEGENPDEKIKEQVKDLQINQVRILYVYKYTKHVKDQFGDSVDVSISSSQGIISLDGRRADVTKAKQLALEMVNKIMTRELAVPEPERMLFFTKKEIAFVHWLREKRIKCALVPNPAQRTLSINSLSEKEIESCIKAINQDIISIQIDCNLLTTKDERFNDFLNELRQESRNDFIFVDNIRTLNQFKLAGFRDQVNQSYKILLNKFTE